MYKPSFKTPKAFASKNWVRVGELSGELRSDTKKYWTELYGSEYASDMVRDFEPEGEKKEVAA